MRKGRYIQLRGLFELGIPSNPTAQEVADTLNYELGAVLGEKYARKVVSMGGKDAAVYAQAADILHNRQLGR